MASKRFCGACMKITTFEYKRELGHSRCVKCGGFIALNHEAPTIKRLIEQRDKYHKKYDLLKKHIKLRHKKHKDNTFGKTINYIKDNLEKI